MNDQTFINEVLSKNSFILEWKKGAVLPEEHPNYYNGRINISIKRNYDNIYGYITIEKEEYKITNQLFEKIYNYIASNIEKLIKIALNQSEEMYNGVSNSLRIKYKSIYINISELNTSNQEEIDYIKEIKEEIKKIIISNKEDTMTKTNIDESLRIGKNYYAEDAETKQLFDSFMARVQKYNEQIKNNQTPDDSFDGLIKEFEETFYSEDLEKERKEIKEKYQNNERPYFDIDGLVKKIDDKIASIEKKDKEDNN